jgi:Protein phosphatase 2C
MWKVAFKSVSGTSHEESLKPCQDYSLGRVISVKHETVLLAACADGAGSAEFSDVGALLACATYLEQAEADLLQETDPIRFVDREAVLRWHMAARERVAAEAADRGVPVRELACTLLTAIVGETWAVFSQVGDGAIVRGNDVGCEPVFWPQNGEYANTTFFLTDDSLAERVQFMRVEEAVARLAILTDGLQMLALDFAAQRSHNPFFLPIFRGLEGSEDLGQLALSLTEFLQSPRVNERTNDDKTLLLAVRCLPQDHEPDCITPPTR